jgi:hypothetical protein
MGDNIALGNIVRDVVTQFEGTVTGLATYLHEKPQARVEGIDSTGRPITDWVVLDRLTIINS